MTYSITAGLRLLFFFVFPVCLASQPDSAVTCSPTRAACWTDEVGPEASYVSRVTF